MPSFAAAPYAEVKPKHKEPNPNKGVRKAAFMEVLEQVQTVLVPTDPTDENRNSLIVQLDAQPGDKTLISEALTTKNRIERAAAQLGISVHVQRRGNRIIAAKTGEVEPVVPNKGGRPKK